MVDVWHARKCTRPELQSDDDSKHSPLNTRATKTRDVITGQAAQAASDGTHAVFVCVVTTWSSV